ncbi:MAG TPA: hypothetical protein VME69_11425, partial [Methylocella sp.]|nr:hypothetical protein [Methylocella sp.]
PVERAHWFSPLELRFDEIKTAHEAQLYELAVSGAFTLIERAARLARSGSQLRNTKEWLVNGLNEMEVFYFPSNFHRGLIKILEVLDEQ